MIIRRIFTDVKNGWLWAVCYPEDRQGLKWTDVFRKLMNQWTDTSFLMDFFLEHQEQLKHDFWGNLSVDDAIDKVLEECNALEQELYAIESLTSKDAEMSFSKIFLPLHNNIYSLNFSNDKFKKARPDFIKPMLRIYALELEDKTLIVTGGAIKLTRTMEGDIFDVEKKRLLKLRDYLRSEGISDSIGLID